MLFDDKRPLGRPSIQFGVIAVAVLESLQSTVDEIVDGRFDVGHRQEIVIEVPSLGLGRALVRVTDAEADRTAHHTRPVGVPGEFFHFIRLRRRPADVFAGNGHSSDVDEEIGLCDIAPDRPILAELVDRVIRDGFGRNPRVDSRTCRESRIRRDVRRNAEMSRFVDVSVDDRNVEFRRIVHIGANGIDG